MRDPDTSIGAGRDRFPTTRHSLLRASRGPGAEERRRAIDSLITIYWRPAYKYVRLRWRQPNEDAKDLIQGFFARMLEKDFFAGYDPERAAFRTFLRVCLDRYVANQMERGQRTKRGGDAVMLPLDFESADGELCAVDPVDPVTLEDFFEREAVRCLFATAADKLRELCQARGKQVHFQLFSRYDLEDLGVSEATYAELAREFGIAETQVTNHLAWARREFRRIVLEQLRAITASEPEFRSEARRLGVR